MASRFINFGQTPISEGVQELPIEILAGKAQDISKQNDLALKGYMDTYGHIQGGYGTKAQAEAANKLIDEQAKLLTEGLMDPNSGGVDTILPRLFKSRKTIQENPDYQSAVIDYKYKADFEKQYKEDVEKGNLQHYIGKDGQIVQNPLGQVINPLSHYNRTPFADVFKRVDVSLDKITADASTWANEDIKNLKYDPTTHNLYKVSSSGETKIFNEYLPKYLAAINAASVDITSPNTPEGVYLTRARQQGKMPEYAQYYDNYRTNAINSKTNPFDPGDVKDDVAKTGLGIVLSRIPLFRVNDVSSKTGYDKVDNTDDITKRRAEIEPVVIVGNITSENTNNPVDITGKGTYSGARTNVSITMNDYITKGNYLKTNYPQIHALIASGKINKFEDLDKYKNSPEIQNNYGAIKAVGDYFNARTSYNAANDSKQTLENKHKTTIDKTYTIALNGINNDSTLSKEDKTKLKNELDVLHKQHLNEDFSNLEGQDYFSHLSNTYQKYTAGKYWINGVNQIKDGYEKNKTKDVTTYDIRPGAGDKYALESITNSVKSGEINIIGKNGKAIPLGEKYKGYYSITPETTHFKIDADGNVYLNVETKKTKDGPTVFTEEKIKMNKEKSPVLEGMFTNLIKSPDITQQEAGIIGLTNIYLENNGLDSNFRDLDTYGQTDIKIGGEDFKIERVGKEYIVSNGGVTSKYTSLSAVKKDLGESLLFNK